MHQPWIVVPPAGAPTFDHIGLVGAARRGRACRGQKRQRPGGGKAPSRWREDEAPPRGGGARDGASAEHYCRLRAKRDRLRVSRGSRRLPRVSSAPVPSWDAEPSRAARNETAVRSERVFSGAVARLLEAGRLGLSFGLEVALAGPVDVDLRVVRAAGEVIELLAPVPDVALDGTRGALVGHGRG